MPAKPQPALPEPKPTPGTNLDREFEELVELVFHLEHLDRRNRGRWGWLGGGSGSAHVCSPPGSFSGGLGVPTVDGMPIWKCPECGQGWHQTLSGPWTTC
jgi:hypothetical protein